jgi:hypothetical protein
MRKPNTLIPLVACALLLALPAASARANASDDRIVQDCQHSATGALTGAYTKAQLSHALHNLPGDVLEYSGCYDAINQALLAAAARHGGSGGGSGGGTSAGGLGAGAGSGTPGTGGSAPSGGSATVPSAPPPPDAARPLTLAGASIAPGTLPVIGRDSHRLPTALVVLLGLLGAAAAAAAAMTIGRRVVAARRP